MEVAEKGGETVINMYSICTAIQLAAIDWVCLLVFVPRSPPRGVALHPSRLLGKNKENKSMQNERVYCSTVSS